MEEALPSRFQPTPLAVSQPDTSFDPALIATPERRLPTVVPLHNRASVSPIAEDDTSCGRVMRVHFDKNVAVHHLSPEYVDSSESQDEQFPLSDCRTTEGMVCHELDLSNLSDEPISVVASDLRKCSLSSANGTKLRGSCAKRLTNVTNYVSENLKGNTANQLSLKKHYSHNLVSEKSDCAIKELVTGLSGGHAANHKSQRHKKKISENNSHKKAVNPIVVSETGSTAGYYPIENPSNMAASSSKSIESDCMLAKPELNSTLRLGREIEQVKEQEFNFSDVLKEKINPKMKNKLAEKAYSKLNAESDMFPCLIGIDVSENDLVTQLNREQPSRTSTSETIHREKAEDKISRIPDVMDFFARNLHKETPSVSMVAMSSFQLEPRTADLDHAFDLYRHIRTWEKL